MQEQLRTSSLFLYQASKLSKRENIAVILAVIMKCALVECVLSLVFIVPVVDAAMTFAYISMSQGAFIATI